MMNRRAWRGVGVCGVVGLLALCLGWPGLARGQSIDELNKVYEPFGERARGDRVLLPVLIKMDMPPAPYDDPSPAVLHRARLLPTTAREWSGLEAWASAPAQRAALVALAQSVEGPSTAMAFTQPYGIEGIDPSLVRAGAYTDLGDPPLFAAARFLYLDYLHRLDVLAQVEMTRLVAAGEPAAALSVAAAMVELGRQLADRQMFQEAQAGYVMMIQNLDRMRDVLFQDFRGDKRIALEELRAMVDRLTPEAEGLALSVLRFPAGNRVAALQLVQVVYRERGGPNEAAFSTVLARLSAGGRPLRLFAEAARWDGLRGSQVDWFEARNEAEKMYQGWAAKWQLGAFDPSLKVAFYWDEADQDSVAAVRSALPDMSELFALRQTLRAELAGTRASLAVVGYARFHGVLPPQLSAVRPQWIDVIPEDPMREPPRLVTRSPVLEFFVPERDDRLAGPREDKRPHEMRVFPLLTENFEKRLFSDVFVLYSVGPDGKNELAREVSQDPRAITGDYLLFPPLLSLEREYLTDRGRLR